MRLSAPQPTPFTCSVYEGWQGGSELPYIHYDLVVSLSLLVSALQSATTAMEGRRRGRGRHEGKKLKYSFDTQE
jgi:hypothetical protein